MWVDTSAGEPGGFMALQGVPPVFCHLFVPPELSRRAHRGMPKLEKQKWDKNCCAQPPPLEKMDIPGSAGGLSTGSEPPGSCLDPAGVRKIVILNQPHVCDCPEHTHPTHPTLLLVPPSTCSLV